MSQAPQPRGAFIVLEGLDRSGKTTQAKTLEERLAAEGRQAQAMRFPDRTTVIGQMINDYLRSDVEMEDHVIHLLFSANRWEAANRIKALLEKGVNVVCDRYYHSGMVYSAAKGKPDLDLNWAHASDVGLPKPDIVVFLDLTPDEARRRGGWGDEKYEKEEMQRKVRELFTSLAESDEELVVVDAGGSITQVADKIWELVNEQVVTVAKENSPVGTVK